MEVTEPWWSLSLPLPKDLPARGSFRPQLTTINPNYRRQSPKQAENTTVLSHSRETLCLWGLSSYGWQESGGKLSRNHQLQEEDQVLPFKSPTGGRAGSPSPSPLGLHLQIPSQAQSCLATDFSAQKWAAAFPNVFPSNQQAP